MTGKPGWTALSIPSGSAAPQPAFHSLVGDPALFIGSAAALEGSGGRGTRWDRARLNRPIGSIPVAPALALAGARVTRHRAIS
jgi:hypothetical protein